MVLLQRRLPAYLPDLDCVDACGTRLPRTGDTFTRIWVLVFIVRSQPYHFISRWTDYAVLPHTARSSFENCHTPTVRRSWMDAHYHHTYTLFVSVGHRHRTTTFISVEVPHTALPRGPDHYAASLMRCTVEPVGH